MGKIIHLSAAGGIEDAPEWLTQEYLDACASNEGLQKNWEPKVGDWYFCTDIYYIHQIKSLKDYYSMGDLPPLKTDQGKDENGHWECDIYLPPPNPSN